MWPKEYQDLRRAVTKFYGAYGGISAILRSPYFHVAVILCAGSTLYWAQERWYEPYSRISGPLLAFTLSGFALMVSLLTNDAREALGGSTDGKPSPLTRMSAIFFHFIIVSCISLVVTFMMFPMNEASVLMLFDGSDEVPAWLWLINDLVRVTLNGIGFFLFCYSATLTAAAAISLPRLLTIVYDRKRSVDQPQQQA